MKSSRVNFSQFSSFCGIFAPVMMMVVIVITGQITPDYNPMSETVSQMGTPERPFSILLNGGYWIYGILMSFASYSLYRHINFTTQIKKIAVLLGIHAMFTILLGVFPDSLDILPKDITDNFLHNFISAVSYLPLLASIFIFCNIRFQEKSLKILGTIGLIILAVNLPMPVIGRITILEPIEGLLQRLLWGSSLLWISTTFLLLYRSKFVIKSTEIQPYRRPLVTKPVSK